MTSDPHDRHPPQEQPRDPRLRRAVENALILAQELHRARLDRADEAPLVPPPPGSAPATAPPVATRPKQALPLDEPAVRAGVTLDEFQSAWSCFLSDGDLVAAWNQSTLDLLQGHTTAAPETVLLKAAYCNWRRGPSGPLEAVLAREGLPAPALPFRGRAADRLAGALAVLQLLRDHATGRAKGG